MASPFKQMKHVYFFLLLFALYSCSDENKNLDVKQISIHFNETSNDLFNTSQLIDSTYYIILDSTFLLGKVDEIKVDDEFFYFIDKHNGTISKFEKNGNFVDKFKRSGHSKSEYVVLSDADISRNGDIHVYDVSSHRILRYSGTGDYLDAFEFDDIARDFVVLDNGDYLFYTPDYQFGAHSGLWKTDSVGTFKKQLISVDEGYKYGLILPSYIKKYDDDIYGIMGGEDRDNIYRVSSDTVITSFHINVNLKIPKRVQSEMNFDIERYKGQIYSKMYYLESNRWMLLYCTDYVSTVFCYYDKKNDLCYHIYSSDNYVDDLDFVGFEGSDCIFNGKYWITLLEPYTILNTESLRKKFPNITENSNPVIRVAMLSD